jgi:hypothetical protein
MKNVFTKKFCLVLINIIFLSKLFSKVNETFLLPSVVEEISLMTGLNSLSEDISSVFHNPSGIAMTVSRKVSLNYGNLFNEIKSGCVIGVFPINETNFSLGIKYYNLGESDFFDEFGTKINSKNLFAYSIFAGFGNEMFLPGFYSGISFGIQNVNLKKEYQIGLSRLGVIYIFPINETELHFGLNCGIEYSLNNKEITFIPAVGIKYFIPEYETFFLLGYKNVNNIPFYSSGLEISFVKNINLTLGYELAKQKEGFLTNFGIGIKFDFLKKQSFDLSFGFKTGGVLGQSFVTSIGFKL